MDENSARPFLAPFFLPITLYLCSPLSPLLLSPPPPLPPPFPPPPPSASLYPSYISSTFPQISSIAADSLPPPPPLSRHRQLPVTHNGDGPFTEVREGTASPALRGKASGVVATDINNDGPDGPVRRQRLPCRTSST